MPTDLRAEFPVLERIAYLNTGTDGPIPRRAVEAAAAATERELRAGRSGRAHSAWASAIAEEVRAEIAALMAAAPEEVALTRSTTDGVNTVVSGLALGPGDEALTSDEEHPGVLAPLAAAQRRHGFAIRSAPFAELAAHAGPDTRLIASSHVSWVSGLAIDSDALAATDALVLLDGAQGLGAVPVDPRALGCDFYAASGQKWLCGPDGTGYLWVHPDRLAELAVPWPSYVSLDDPGRAAELPVHPDCRRFDMGVLEAGAVAWALAALRLLGGVGWPAIHARAARLAARFAEALAAGGHEVLPRGDTTLVAWRTPEDEAERTVARLTEAGVVVRHLPGRALLRASVGAWSSEEDLERLLAGLGY